MWENPKPTIKRDDLVKKMREAYKKTKFRANLDPIPLIPVGDYKNPIGYIDGRGQFFSRQFVEENHKTSNRAK